MEGKPTRWTSTNTNLVPCDAQPLQQRAARINKALLVRPEHGRVILIQKDARVREVVGEVVAQPQASLKTGWFTPRVPSMVLKLLVSRVQPVDGNDTWSRGREVSVTNVLCGSAVYIKVQST
jgi:hypothetical protein